MLKNLKIEKRKLEKEIATIKRELSVLPKENLLCENDGKYCNWFIGNGQNKVYLSKKERQKAMTLAKAKYLRARLADIESDVVALDTYINQIGRERSSDLLLKNKNYRELVESSGGNIASNYETSDDTIKEWLEEEYESNPNYLDNLIVPSITGQKVRSKSEATILGSLYGYKIPYKYEAPLMLNGNVYYPDFTIMHPITHKILYWEHFGKMDEPKYKIQTSQKLQLYITNNIIPLIDLITTYETAKHPLDVTEVNMFIERYLLQ